jgi:uncharacterized protein YrzB (UPF0473 family)
MERNPEFFTVTDENGKDIQCEIIMTFDSDEFGKSYVVYQVVGDESGEYYAASFNPEDGVEGRLFEVETEAEWDFIEEVLESYLEDSEAEDDGSAESEEE